MKEFVEKAAQKIQKLSSEQLEQLINSMQADNIVFTSVIESLSTGLIILNQDWQILMHNKAVERFIPFKTHHLDGNDEKLWQLVDDDEISDYLKLCETDCRMHCSKEFSFASDDKVYFLNIRLQPLVQEKKVTGTIICVDDVTAKRQQEILTRRMESLSSLTNLAASVAHEIKNPLGAISIHIQLLQKSVKKAREKDGLLPDEKFMEHYLDVVNEEIDNLNKIVLDFLFAVKPIHAKLELLNPEKIIEKTLEFYESEFDAKGVKLVSKLSGENTHLLIDDKLFREILVNLLQNALSAIQSQNNLKTEEKKGEIVIHSEYKNDNFILSIADNGCGMDRETCSRVFEPYYTTKANGTGLGLTTVYKIIKDFHGDINVTSEVGVGTIFTIRLPVPQEKTMMIESDLAKISLEHKK